MLFKETRRNISVVKMRVDETDVGYSMIVKNTRQTARPMAIQVMKRKLGQSGRAPQKPFHLNWTTHNFLPQAERYVSQKEDAPPSGASIYLVKLFFCPFGLNLGAIIGGPFNIL